MAKPQLEDGYTKIANDILEQLASLPLNGTQFRIVLTVIRYTYGFNRKSHSISVSFLANMTGLHKDNIKRELNNLINWNIISVRGDCTFTKSRELAFNKDYDRYLIKHQGTKTTPGGESTTSPGGELTTSPGGELTPQEIKYKKNNKEKYICSFFDELWKLYPRKSGKSAVTKKAMQELNEVGAEKMKQAIERYRAEIKENQTQGQYIMYGSTFFNGRYKDYLQPEQETANNKTLDEETIARIKALRASGGCVECGV